jgi:hypothetical protein
VVEGSRAWAFIAACEDSREELQTPVSWYLVESLRLGRWAWTAQEEVAERPIMPMRRGDMVGVFWCWVWVVVLCEVSGVGDVDCVFRGEMSRITSRIFLRTNWITNRTFRFKEVA